LNPAYEKLLTNRLKFRQIIPIFARSNIVMLYENNQKNISILKKNIIFAAKIND